nr:hypothetical protein [Planotetraspora sp. A-T 1434]
MPWFAHVNPPIMAIMAITAITSARSSMAHRPPAELGRRLRGQGRRGDRAEAQGTASETWPTSPTSVSSGGATP